MTRHTLPKLSAIAALLVTSLIFSPPASAQFEDVAYGSTFTDANDWTLTGLWAVDAYPLQGPGQGSPNSINFNNAAGNFAGFNTGTARSPVIDAGDAEWHHLHFSCRYGTGTTGIATDRRWLRVLDPISGTTLYYGQFAGTGGTITCSTMNQWHQHDFELDQFASRYLQFEFYFDSVDDANNNGTGWFIDNFIIHIEDLAPPDAIGNLMGSLIANSFARLTWYSPWDRLQALQNGAEFDLRYSNEPITDVNWNYSSTIRVYDEPKPGQPGAFHTLEVHNLASGRTYYFALRTIDAAGNVSPLSNVVAMDTQGSVSPPQPDFDDESKSQGYLNPECSAGSASSPSALILLAALVALAAAGRKSL